MRRTKDIRIKIELKLGKILLHITKEIVIR